MAKFYHKTANTAVEVEADTREYHYYRNSGEWIQATDLTNQVKEEQVTKEEPKELTVKELKNQAKDLQIPGYSNMNKAALIEAIDNYEPEVIEEDENVEEDTEETVEEVVEAEDQEEVIEEEDK